MRTKREVIWGDEPAQPKQTKQARREVIWGDEEEQQQPQDPMEQARQQVTKQYPNMPEWLREGILKAAPHATNPLFGNAARGFSAVTDTIPAAAGGLLQGASLPIRGAVGLIPTETAQRLANVPNLANILPQAQGGVPKAAEFAGELAGGAGPLAQLFKAGKAGAQLARLPKFLQNAAGLATAGAVGTPGSKEERALGAGTALALGGAGKLASKAAGAVANKVPGIARGLFNPPDIEAAVQAVQKPHDIMQSTGSELYSQVRQAIKKRGIKIPISDALLDEAAPLLPKSRDYKKLIADAKSGDYQAVHDLQSNLFKRGTKAMAHDEPAVSNRGEETLDLRKRINEQLENHLIKEGNLDIAHVLRQAKKNHAQLQETYYGKNLKKSISKMVHPELRLIPEKPLDMFKENSVPMNAFLEKHPEIGMQIMKEREHEMAKESLGKLLKKTAYTGATVAGGKSVHDLISP